MKYRTLGRSGLIVSDLCLGGMLFGEQTTRGTSGADATRMISHFLAAGGNFIDTADRYGDGRSEEIISEALRGQRDQVVLGTKVRFPETGNHDMNGEALIRRGAGPDPGQRATRTLPLPVHLLVHPTHSASGVKPRAGVSSRVTGLHRQR